MHIGLVVVASIMLAALLRFTRRRFGSRLWPSVRDTSPSIYDLYWLADVEADRASSIRAYYEWKERALLTGVKALLGFALANVTIFVKAVVFPTGHLESLAAESVSRPTGLIPIAVFLVAVLMLFVSRLRRIPSEYLASVNIYNRFRQ